MFRGSLFVAALFLVATPAWCGFVTYHGAIQPIDYSIESSFVSIPSLMEYRHEMAFEFEIDAGEHVAYVSEHFWRGARAFCPSGEMGGVGTSTQLQIWAVSGGPVELWGYGTSVVFGWSGGSHSEVGHGYRTIPVLGSDATGPLHFSLGAGDSISCGHVVSDMLRSSYDVWFRTNGSEPTRIHMLVEHRASLSGYSTIPEPGTLATISLAAVVVRVCRWRRRCGLRIPSPGSPSRTGPRA